MNLLANLRKVFSENLIAYRKKRGWNQHDLAAELGWSVGTVRNYEQMIRWPDPERLEELSKALRCAPADLLSTGEKSDQENEKLRKILTDVVSVPDKHLHIIEMVLKSVLEPSEKKPEKEPVAPIPIKKAT